MTSILGVRDVLAALVGREKVSRPKPDPDVYLAAAQALDVSPSRYPPSGVS